MRPGPEYARIEACGCHILAISGEAQNNSSVSVRCLLFGNRQIGVSGQLDHEFFGFKALLTFALAFSAANRCANAACLRRIDIGKPEIGSVDPAAITIRPIDGGDGFGCAGGRQRTGADADCKDDPFHSLAG